MMQKLHRDDDDTRSMTAVSVVNADGDQDRTGSALTASEQLIWTGQRLDPGAPLYNMALSIEIATAVDVPAFLRAFRQLVHGTDALRTSFIDVGGQPRRVVTRSGAGAG